MKALFRSSKILLVNLGFLLLISQCGEHRVAGTGSETGNSLAGTLITSTGSRQESLTVFLYALDYQPHILEGISKTGATNQNGEFRFDFLEAGRFNLVVLDPLLGEGVFIPNIEITNSKPTKIGIKSLMPLGKLSGTIQDTTGKWLPPSVIFSPGTPFFTDVKISGNFSIDGVPEGSFLLKMDYKYLRVEGSVSKVDSAQAILPTATIISGKTTILETVILQLN